MSEDSSDDEPAYEVGYGKPPKHTRFQKGKSGNPKGRARGDLNLKTVLEAELRSRVSVTLDGKTVMVTKLLLIVKNMVASAAKGDVRARQQIIDLTRAFGLGEAEEHDAGELTPDDAAILAEALRDLAEGGSE